MRADAYRNLISGNSDYESVYDLVSQMSDDPDVSNQEWKELYDLAKETLGVVDTK